MDKNNLYTFDENAVLHLVVIVLPPIYVPAFGERQLMHRNYGKLKALTDTLHKYDIPKYRFVPSKDLPGNILKVANELMEKTKVTIMPKTLKAEIIDCLQQFSESLTDWKEIKKLPAHAQSIKKVFESHEQELKRDKNIPEDDDCAIIAGLCAAECEGTKFIITADEHFWGYKGLLQQSFTITVVETWNCNALL